MTDRSQAISLVEAAIKSGRIIQADGDMRIDQIKGAASDQEVELVVRDLVGHQPQAVQPWPLVNYGPQQGQGAVAAADLAAVTRGGGKWIGGIIGLVVLISVIVPIVGVVIGLASARDSLGDLDFAQPVDETTYVPGQVPGENGVNVHTLDGIEAMFAGLEEKTGSTEAFGAVIYPRYAVVEVPESPKGKRYRNYYWDGRTMALQDYKSTTDDPRIDLRTFDASIVLTLLEDVRGRVEDPTSWYVSIGSDVINSRPQISAYASNEYGEGAYILAAADGTITYESAYGG